MKTISLYNWTDTFLKMKEDEDALEESITRILLTLPGERVNNLDFGCKFKSYIFESQSVMEEEMKSEIYKSISKWEPRVSISDIRLEQKDENKIAVRIVALNKDTLEVFTYEKTIQY